MLKCARSNVQRPLQLSRQLSEAIVDMEHAPGAGCLRGIAGMKRQRLHGEEAACRHGAGLSLATHRGVPHLRVGQPSEAMAAADLLSAPFSASQSSTWSRRLNIVSSKCAGASTCGSPFLTVQ